MYEWYEKERKKCKHETVRRVEEITVKESKETRYHTPDPKRKVGETTPDFRVLRPS